MQDEVRKNIDALTTSAYESSFVPQAIAENRYKVEPEHFKKYQQQFLQKKKLLEIQILRDNKNHEVIQQIIQEKEVDRNRKEVRTKALKAIQDGKKFSNMTKQIELLADYHKKK